MLPTDAQLLRDIADLKARVSRLEVYASSAVYGTWAPAFQGSSTAGVFTYTNQVGYYIRLGGQVFIHGRVSISAIGTPPVGTMRISGLPYPSAATYLGGFSFGWISNFNYAANAIQLTAVTGVGLQYLALYESFDSIATVAAPAANFANVDCDIIVSGHYLI